MNDILLFEDFKNNTPTKLLSDINSIIDKIKDKKVLLLSTSNRWHKTDLPKSTIIAKYIASKVTDSKLIDVSKLTIYPCEGNVSAKGGNSCGVKEALIKNKDKNKSGELRCWASFNNTDDELYKISDAILESDIVIFTGSVRWGSPNIYYQKLIERLTWLENRHTNLGENNIIKDITAGCIFLGHNWNVETVVNNIHETLNFFGFKSDKDLCIGYQYTDNSKDESNKSYIKDDKLRDSFDSI